MRMNILSKNVEKKKLRDSIRSKVNSEMLTKIPILKELRSHSQDQHL